MKKRTPQEKKALSYVHDRRNTLHENDKASRRLIPLGKARANRAYRKKVNDVLGSASGQDDTTELELIESKAAAIGKFEWEKYPDTPLGEVVEEQKDRRESHAGKGKTARKRLREFLANLKVEVEQETDGRWIADAQGIPVGVLVYGETPEKAVERCKDIARGYFLEELGIGRIVKIEEDSVRIETYS